MPRFFLGVDGGQSSTTALIAEETGRIIGRGRGGPCNHVTGGEGRRKFFHAVGASIGEACAGAQLDAASIEFENACLGFSGGAADKSQYSRELIRAKSFQITHDAEIALSGAMAGEPGIIIIAGTGSMAFGRNRSGRTARAGGWGYVFGDEGGGFDIACRALRAVLRSEEGWGPATMLRELLLEATGSSNANDLLHRFYTSEFSRPQIAAFSQLVTQAAERGDEEALAILNDAAAALSTYVEGVARNLFGSAETAPVAYIGGVFRSRGLLDSFQKTLLRRTGAEVRPPAFSPAVGAVLQAMRGAGLSVTLSNVPDEDK